MGVKIRKRGGKWYVFVNYHGHRKAKCVGTSRELAEHVRRQLEAKLALGDLALFDNGEKAPTFGSYADKWLKDYARVQCKTSTAAGYEGVIEQYLRPRFGNRALDQIKRDDIKTMLNELIGKELSRNTVRNALCVIRGIFNEAIEMGIVEVNPAARLGRFTRIGKTALVKGISLTPAEADQFLQAAKEICPEYHPLFLMAFRAGLRRGELVAVQWGDVQFGKDEDDPNRFIVVQHNYVHREHTTTKSKKSRRVDMSRELRRALIELRDKRLLDSFLKGKNDISSELVFLSPDCTILDPDNLYHRYFQPVLTKAGLRKIRLHDLRHTFGSLLIQSGASIVYVKEQMGHSSIQVTVDIYGHLIPGANVSFIDRLDEMPTREEKTTPQQNATQAQLPDESETDIPSEVADLIGGGAWTRTTDLRIMRPSL
jgi:integrase